MRMKLVLIIILIGLSGSLYSQDTLQPQFKIIDKLITYENFNLLFESEWDIKGHGNYFNWDDTIYLYSNDYYIKNRIPITNFSKCVFPSDPYNMVVKFYSRIPTKKQSNEQGRAKLNELPMFDSIYIYPDSFKLIAEYIDYHKKLTINLYQTSLCLYSIELVETRYYDSAIDNKRYYRLAFVKSKLLK